MTPTQPGFFWYQDADVMMCVKVEIEDGVLTGYATGADTANPQEGQKSLAVSDRGH